MRSVRPVLVFICVLTAGSASAQSASDLTGEREAVLGAVTAYMDGVMAGDGERVAGVLHPEFSKAGPFTIPQTGRQCLNRVGSSYEFVVAGARGETVGEGERNIEMEVLGVGHDLASVRAVSSVSHEYIQLAKIEGVWKLLNVLWVPIGTAPETGDESEAELVKTTALNYIDGAYSGDADRMARALARDFHKVVPATVPTTGKTLLSHSSASLLIEATAAQRMNLDADERAIDLTVQDVSRGIASVWIVSAMYIDLLQIAKINDEWKIVNVLWVANPDAPGRGS